jgi:hypothetical protein
MATNVTSATGAARPTGGSVSADHYAEGSALGTFAVYSIANFRFNKVDFVLPGSANIDNIVTAEYTLTTNNRTFAAGSTLEFFLTTDQMNGDFTGKTFNAATPNGINNANYTFAPVSLGVFPFTPATTAAQGGLPNTFTLNLSAVKPELLAQLNAGAEFSIILAATTTTTAVTYSGKGNTFDPGDPSLKLIVNQTTGVDTTSPTVAAFTPADGFSGFPLSSNLSIRFNELVQKGASGTISIFNTSGNVLVEAINVTSSQVTVSNATVTIDPTSPLVSGNTYYVQVSAGAIEDVSGNVYAGFTDTTTWDFTTSQPPRRSSTASKLSASTNPRKSEPKVIEMNDRQKPSMSASQMQAPSAQRQAPSPPATKSPSPSQLMMSDIRSSSVTGPGRPTTAGSTRYSSA